MNVLVAGATGKTGQRVVRELLSRGHQPVALVRESSDTSNLPNEVVLREGDLTNLQDDICADCESVVFAAGSGGGTSKEMTDQVDRDGAMRLTDIAVNSDTKRFVMLSSVGADDPPAEGDMAHYLQAKHDADEHLKASGLNYSILRPVSLTNEEGMREIIIGDEVNKKATAARGDVAAVLAQALDNDQWCGQTVTMQSR